MRLPHFALYAFAAAVVVACGPTSYAPPDSTAPAAHDAARRLVHSIGCGLANQPLPGNYFFFRADGNLGGKTYAGHGVWEYGKVLPTTEPATSDPSPPPTDVYVYSGRYSLSTLHQTGCAYLVTTKSGKPFYGNVNGLFDASPPFEHKAFAMKAAQGGALAARLEFTDTGASGKILLSNGPTQTGTIVIDKRQSGADFIAAMQPRYTFSCDPKKFIYQTVQTGKPGTARGFGFTLALPPAQLVPRFSFCGQENSYLAASEVTSSQTYAFSHGALDYRLSATFSSSIDWANRPDVAVWEEAYRADGSRDDRADIFVALIRVR